MGRIEDLCSNYEANAGNIEKKNNMDNYNRDIDIINEVIKDILATAETKRTKYYSWTAVKHDYLNFTRCIAWVVCRVSGEDNGEISLLSNGRLLYSEYDVTHPRKIDHYIELKHVKSPDELKFLVSVGKGKEWPYVYLNGVSAQACPLVVRLRNEIVGLAVSLNVKARDNWDYSPVQESKPIYQMRKTEDLLSEILSEIKQLRT